MKIESFVAKYGGRARAYRGGWLLNCPLGNHPDNTPSFSLSTTGLFKCWSCQQGGNYIRLLHDVAEIPWKHAAEIVENLGLRTQWDKNKKLVVYGQDIPPTISKAMLGLFDVDWQAAYALYTAHGDNPKAHKPPWALVFEKGILPSTLMEYEVGYDKELQRITIPVFNAGSKLLGMVGRTCRPTDFKYVAYNNLKPSRHVYNLERTTVGDPVVVVEGAFDVWMLHQWKIPFTAVAIMTSHISNEQVIKLLEKHSEIYVFFDGDDAGKRGAVQTASALMKRGGRVDVINTKKGVQDIKKMDHASFMKQYTKRLAYPF